MRIAIHHPHSTFAVAAAALAVLAAGCGSSDKTSSTTTPASAPAATGASGALALSADPGGALKFDKTTLDAKAGKVTIALTNPSSSGLPHAIAVEGNGVDKDGATTSPGKSSKLTLTLKPGKYTFYCPVGNHEAAGMKGTLVVK